MFTAAHVRQQVVQLEVSGSREQHIGNLCCSGMTPAFERCKQAGHPKQDQLLLMLGLACLQLASLQWAGRSGG
jgi:hypothetical protein